MSKQKEMKIHKSLLGGFRKKDVVRYVETLNTEKEQTERELRDRISQLEREQEEIKPTPMDALVVDAIEQNKTLSARVTELLRQLEERDGQLAEANESIRKLQDEKEYAFSTVASTQAELIRTKELAEKNAAAVLTVNDTDKQVYSLDELLQEIRSYRMIAAALRENTRKLSDSLSRQMDFADKYIDGLSAVTDNKS